MSEVSLMPEMRRGALFGADPPDVIAACLWAAGGFGILEVEGTMTTSE